MVSLERFNQRTRKVMELANTYAARQEDDYIGAQHILLAMLDEERGRSPAFLRDQQIDPDALRHVLEPPRLPASVHEPTSPGLPRAKAILDGAIHEADALGADDIGPEHLLLALLNDAGEAGHILQSVGLSRAQTLSLISA